MDKLNSFKNLISKYLMCCVRNVNKLINKIEENDRILGENIFDDLAPIDDADNDGKYSDAFNFAFKNKRIKNIAVTGPYGSGKSSVILSYLKNHREHNFLNISLAAVTKNSDFDILTTETIKDKTEEKTTIKKTINIDENLINKIERSILQQMFYKVEYKNIPLSRFKRIVKTRSHKIAIIVFGTLVMLFSFGYSFSNYFAFKINSILLSYYDKTTDIISFLNKATPIIFTISFLIISYYLGKFLIRNITLRNIKSKFIEIDIDNNKDKLIFNKYIDEIVYFFESNEFDIVIFQDLDRFDNREIFTKLREVNTLINDSKQIKKMIKFIYAIKDDMFDNVCMKNRTKFFDFIIPIVPIANASNSYDLLCKTFLKDKFKELKPDSKCINTVSAFVDDMRIIKNIINEYVIYYNKLKDTNIFSETYFRNKLFAIVVYKNIYPDDFSLLVYNKGKMHSAVMSKNKLIKDAIVSLNINIETYKKEVNVIENELIESKDELAILYSFKLFLHLNDNNIRINNTAFDLFSIKNASDFEQISEAKTLTDINREPLENSIVEEYKKRLSFLKEDKNKRISFLRGKIADYEKEISKINRTSLKNIASKFGLNIYDNTLIKPLIINGYIDENYQDYLTFFVEGSISNNDLLYVRSVKGGTQQPFELKLTNIEKIIIERLDPDDYSREGLLNFNFVDYIIQNIEDNRHIFETIINECSKRNTTHIEFFDKYINECCNITLFLNEVVKIWPDIWNYYSEEESEKRPEMALIMLKYLKKEEIKLIDNVSNFTEYLSQRENTIELIAEEKGQLLENCKTNLITLCVRLENETIFNENEVEILKFVANNGLFRINIYMIRLILSQFTDFEEDKINSEIYDCVKNSKLDGFIKYIMNEIDIFIKDVYMKMDENNESEKNIIELINNEDIDDDLIISIIKNMDKQIMKIQNLNNRNFDETTFLWDVIFEEKKVIPSWENILNFYNEFGEITDTLINYLNEEYKEFYNLNGSEEKEFIKDLLYNKNISNECITHIINNIINFELINLATELELDKISAFRMNLLIENGLVDFNQGNFDSLKLKYKDSCLILLNEHIDTYFEDIKKVEIKDNDLYEFVKMRVFKLDDRLKLILKFINWIVEEVERIDRIFGEKLEEELVEKVMYVNIPKTHKVRILALQAKHININLLNKSLIQFGYPYSELNKKRKKPKFKKNANNVLLLENLKGIKIKKYKDIEGTDLVRAYNYWS